MNNILSRASMANFQILFGKSSLLFDVMQCAEYAYAAATVDFNFKNENKKKEN